MSIENVNIVTIAVLHDAECTIHWNVKIRGRREDEQDDHEPCVDFLLGKGYSINNINWSVVNKYSEYHEE